MGEHTDRQKKGNCTAIVSADLDRTDNQFHGFDVLKGFQGFTYRAVRRATSKVEFIKRVSVSASSHACILVHKTMAKRKSSPRLQRPEAKNNKYFHHSLFFLSLSSFTADLSRHLKNVRGVGVGVGGT